MDLTMIWRICAIAGFGINVLTLIGVIFVKFNDLRHLKVKVDEIDKRIIKIDEKTDNNSERIATIEGKLSK